MANDFDIQELELFINKRLKGVVFLGSDLDLVIEGDNFDDTFTVYSQLTVQNDERTLSNNEAGFKDDLCKLIGKTISEIELNNTQCIFLFENSSERLMVSLAMPNSDTAVVAFCENQGIFLLNRALG